MIPISDRPRSFATAGYALQASGLFIWITWIAAVVLAYTKRADTRGSWLESHFQWQIETFWGLVVSIGVEMALMMMHLMVMAYVVAAGAALWVLYRIGKGWLYLSRNKRVV